MTGLLLRGPIIEAAARKWIGTPFAHQGRTRGAGVDCAGVIIGVANELGLANSFEDTANYAADPDGRMEKLLAKHLDRVSWNERQQGDVVHVAWSKLPQHVGILTDKNTLIHAFGDAGVVETHISGILERGIRGVYRFRTD